MKNLDTRALILALLVLALRTEISPAAPPDDLTGLLQRRLDMNRELPSLCAVAIVDGALRGAGAAGVRKRGDTTPVTVDDKYHIGSCTKSFTATLAAALVEDGKIQWDSTAGEVLRKLRPHDGYADVTLAQLLTNTGGCPGDVPPDLWKAAWQATGSNTRQRQSFVEAMLRREPAYPAGKGYAYSNTGFSVAGLMLEEATGDSWEELVAERIFVPLGMKSGGFREPAGKRRTPDQPWGHTEEGDPVEPGPSADNPAAIAPAGAVHTSLPDLARYVMLHMKRETGSVIKKAESFGRLHTVAAEDYAMGWIIAKRPWANGPALTHTGSNTMFTTVIWMAPERGFAVIVATNIGAGVAAKPCDEVAGDLIEKYLE